MNNQGSMLSELVCLDAWSKLSSDGENRASLFVDLSFRKGYFGGSDPEMDFTFTAQLSRAEMVIDLEGPLRITRGSVAREGPDREIEIEQYKQIRRELAQRVGGSLTITTNSFAAKLGAMFHGLQSIDDGVKARLIQKVPPILLSTYTKGAQSYGWEMEASFDPFLFDRPWPSDQPRFAIDGTARERQEYAVKISINCRESDLHIRDIEAKDKGLAEKFGAMVNWQNKDAVARQYVRKRMIESNLTPSAYDNRFADIVLASVLAAHE